MFNIETNYHENIVMKTKNVIRSLTLAVSGLFSLFPD
jgi:hypothetical protein